jgi:hypothetical protein
MNESGTIDFSKLLGFELVADQPSQKFDFQDRTVSARLGAKVGEVTLPLPTTKACDSEKD